MSLPQSNFEVFSATIPGVLYQYVLRPDGSNQYLYVGPGSEEVLELKEADLMGNSMLFWQMVHPDDIEALCEADRIANSAGTLFSEDCRIITKSGALKWIHITSRPLSSDPGELATWCGIVQDVTYRKHTEAELRRREQELVALNQKLTEEAAALQEAYATISRIAATDSLTALASRHHFYEALDRSTSAARRHNTPLTVVSFDLDGLKPVNDTAGHDAGDDVLRAFGAILATEIRKEDLAGRLGGDEFSVIMSNADLDAGLSFAERVTSVVQGCQVLADFNVTTSSGVAQLRPDESTHSLMKRADTALYSAKREGKGLVACSPTAAVSRSNLNR